MPKGTSSASSSLVHSPVHIDGAFGLCAFVGGLISFIGWAADVPPLTNWGDDDVSIQPSAALAAMTSGAALMLAVFGFPRISSALGGLVVLLAGSSLLQELTGINLGVETALLFGRQWGRAAVSAPGRMGPAEAVSWVLIGIAVVAESPAASRSRALAPALAVVTSAIAGLSLIGHLYGASIPYTIPVTTGIGFQSSTFILTVSFALMLAVPGFGPVRLLREDSPSGLLVRRFLPAALAMPIGLGLLRLVGQRAELYDPAYGTALLTLAEITLLLTLLWLTTRALRKQNLRSERAEWMLQESERRLRTVTEQAHVGLVTVSPAHRYLFANRAYLQAISSTAEDIVGRHVSDVVPEAYRDDIRPRLDQAFAGEQVRDELALPARDRVLAETYQPQFEGQRVENVIISVVDITERKRVVTALQQTRAQLEGDLADSRLLQGVSADIIEVNNEQALYEKILDAAIAIMRSQFGSLQMLDHEGPGGEAGQLRLLAFRGFPAETSTTSEWLTAGTASVSGKALRHGRRVIVPDVSRDQEIAAGGHLVTYQRAGIAAVQSTPLLSRGGRILGMISTHWNHPHEPSERELGLIGILARQAADLLERRQAEDALRNADRRKDEFLATLAHELRNPLAPVRSAVDLLQDRLSADEDLTWARGVIDRQVGLMSRLLDDLLDVGRIAQDRLELRKQRLDVRTVVQTAAEMSRPLIDGFRHELTLLLPADPVTIDADPARLSQILGNLLNNACRYTPPAGHISMTAEQVGGHAVVRVRDNGIGMRPEELSNIFEMFFQVDKSLERSQGGLGIGLHLARRLVEMHGGRIDAYSAGRGHGSEFVVQLPLAAVDLARDRAALAAEPQRSVTRPQRILIVDDNVDAATCLAMLLSRDGHETHVAHDGPAALEAAERLRPDVILLDIGLPQLNGFEVCRRIRQEPWGRRIVISAITGWGQDLDRRRSEEAGFDHHLIKPVEHGTLLKVLAPEPA